MSEGNSRRAHCEKIMLNETELIGLLKSSETHWVERKKSFDSSEVKEAIVAFANAVPENQCAVLFIGVGPDGKFSHIENADKAQIRISKIAEDECFPPLRCTPTIVRQGDKEIIAVVIEFSKERPHFAGLPYVRVGSKTIKDRRKLQVLLDDLIASRNDKARRILREKGKIVSVISIHPPMQIMASRESPLSEYIERANSHRQVAQSECRIDNCDAFIFHCTNINTGKIIAASLEKIVIGWDVEEARLQLTIDWT